MSRWGEAVQVYDDPQLGNPTATPDELQHAKGTLLHILHLFEESATLSQNYKRSGKGGYDISTFCEDELEPTSGALNKKIKQLALRRQKGTSILKKTKWAIFDGSEFKQLIENITHLTDNLEALFPAPSQQASLISQEIKEIHDGKQLELLRYTAREVDERLRKAADQALTGHRYLGVQVTLGARAVNGDAFYADWERGAIGKNHTYDGVVISEGGKAVNGNQYGGKDIWDD